MTTQAPTQIVSEDLLTIFHERAPRYDRDNTFFTEDFDDLRASGYLNMAVPAVPAEFGGSGYSISQVCEAERRLAYHAPATALATNMHVYWTGVAATLRAMGDNSLDWILQEAADGEVFAAGHGERGNDMPLFLSTTRAERVDGGYRLYGHKMFGSLTPVWTRLGIHAMDSSDASNPQIVHVFMPRDTEGYKIEATWDTLGMRATRSDDTILDGAFVPDQYVARIVPAGQADPFILGIFLWAQLTFASIYLGIADRALDLAVQGASSRTSLALTRSMAYHPEVQHEVAQIVLAKEAASALVGKVANDWETGVDHGHSWPMHLVAAKHNAVEAAKQAVDRAMTISGGGGMFRSNELERLYRDVRCGGFHPANSLFAHELVGKIALGIDLGEQPRWG